MISNFLKFRINAWLRSRAIMALPSLWLNGPGWMAIFQRRREQKNDPKRLLTDTTPKTRALNQDLSIKTCQVCALFRRLEGKCEVGVRPLAVCLRSLAKNNRRHVQQAVSKKKSALLCTPHAFSICLDGFATSEQGMNLLFNLSL